MHTAGKHDDSNGIEVSLKLAMGGDDASRGRNKLSDHHHHHHAREQWGSKRSVIRTFILKKEHHGVMA